jgi:hypothetical protein
LIVLGDYSRAEGQLRTFIRDDPKGSATTEARKLLVYALKRVSASAKTSGAAGG